ncbi:PEP-CTERM sorting domain-containing protein [Patescibacteria group bacterium]|nr:PEP-CTERM sorting domain-containing protein [Patescibacteria group bacterium]
MKYLSFLVMALAMTAVNMPVRASVLANDRASNYPPDPWSNGSDKGSGFASPWMTDKSSTSSQSIGSSDVDMNGVSFKLAAPANGYITVYRTFDNSNGYLGVGQTFYGMLDPIAYNANDAWLSVNLSNTAGQDAFSLVATKMPDLGGPVDETPNYWYLGEFMKDTGVSALQAISFEYARTGLNTFRLTLTPIGGTPVVINDTRTVGDIYGLDVDAYKGEIAFNNVGVGTVPEPASLSVIALASLGLLGRRRR